MKVVPIVYFSDVLCVWAYIAQLRINEVKARYGGQVLFEYRFCSVFGNTSRKVATTWKDKGEYAGFNSHLKHSASAFPELRLHPDLWLTVRPASSASPHLFLKAAQLSDSDSKFEAALWAMRRAFFEEGRDIATLDVQTDVARQAGLDVEAIGQTMRDGRAHAALSSDYDDAFAMGIHGSPSFVLNEGRQKLYGNVGYRVIEANIQELLRERQHDQASWC